MKLKYVGESFGIDSLTNGKIYELEIEDYDYYRVFDDSDEDYLYSRRNPRPMDGSSPGGKWVLVIDELKKRLSEVQSCFEFDYNGKHGGINPIRADKIEVYYGGKSEYADSIDKAIDTPFVDGKKLEEIVNDLYVSNF